MAYHISIYNKGAIEQINKLSSVININKAINLWEQVCNTEWNNQPVWIHGDFAIGNISAKESKLSAIIDFGGMGVGDPACDLVIAWTFFKGRAREIFIKEMALDESTWLRAKAWALWKATFELCELENKNSEEGLIHKRIIKDLLDL